MKSQPTIMLLLFFILSFLISWLFWWPGLIDPLGIDPVLTGLLGAFGPSISAILVIGGFEGKTGLGQLWSKLKQWRVHPKWYLFVLLYQAGLILLTTAIHVAFGGHFPDYSQPLFLTDYPLPDAAKDIPFVIYIIPVFLQQTLIGSSMGEELGWRGLALPKMQKQWNSLLASIILGIIWGIWHLPLWLNPDDIRSTIPFWQTIVGTVATSILFTWLYNNTKQSLILALLFHTGINTTALFLASPEVDPLLTTAVELVVPLLVILMTGKNLNYDKITTDTTE